MSLLTVGEVHPVGLPGLIGAVATAGGTLLLAAGAAVLVACYLADRRITGEPSFVSRFAVRVAGPDGSPIWEPLPFAVVLAGLLLALVGWRAGSAGGPLAGAASLVVALGIAVAVVGGVIASALAHPPVRVVGNAGLDAVSPQLGHPVQAHRVVSRRGRLGAGPVGAVLITGGGALALLAIPVATVWRALQGTAMGSFTPAGGVALAAVGLVSLGVWLLRVEGRRVSASTAGRATRLDVPEVLAATAVLLVLSAMTDAGAPPVAAGLAGVGALAVVRVRTGAGAALAAVVLYVAGRLAAATLALAFGAVLVPLVGQAGLAALAIELVVALVRSVSGPTGRALSSSIS